MTLRERIHDRLERQTAWVYDRAGRVVVLTLVVVAALGTQIPHLTLETDLETFLHPHDPLRVAYDDFRAQFGRDDLVLLTLEAPTCSSRSSSRSFVPCTRSSRPRCRTSRTSRAW